MNNNTEITNALFKFIEAGGGKPFLEEGNSDIEITKEDYESFILNILKLSTRGGLGVIDINETIDIYLSKYGLTWEEQMGRVPDWEIQEGEEKELFEKYLFDTFYKGGWYLWLNNRLHDYYKNPNQEKGLEKAIYSGIIMSYVYRDQYELKVTDIEFSKSSFTPKNDWKKIKNICRLKTMASVPVSDFSYEELFPESKMVHIGYKLEPNLMYKAFINWHTRNPMELKE